MVTWAVVAGLLAAGAAEPIKLALPTLRVVNLEPKESSFYTANLAQLLNYQGVRATTPEDLASLLGFERQQQLMGCGDDRCRALVAVDLGVDGLVVGQVARLEKSFQLDVKVLEPGTGRPLAAASVSAPDQQRFLATLNDAAAQLAEQLSRALGRPLLKGDTRVVSRWSTVKKTMWLPLGLGVGSAVAGGVLLGMARGQYDALAQTGRATPLTPDQTAALVQDGRTQQTAGWLCLGVGAGLVATAAVMFFAGGDETLSAGVAVVPGGAGVTVGGAF